MQIKRYEVNNLQEAMTKIKKDLGPDAIILSTKKMAGSALMEVTAARDAGGGAAAARPSAAPHQEEQPASHLHNLKAEITQMRSSIDLLTHKVFQQKHRLDETMDILYDRIAMANTDHLSEIYLRLIGCGLSRSRAASLVETIRHEFPADACNTFEKGSRIAEKLIAHSLVKDDRKGRRIKAFIGPTGVGKTTTLAKLAAHYSLDRKMKVGLITTDTYRIAAAEQLKVYAKIMGLPVDIASEKEGFTRSVEKFSDKDIILVDTPGRSQYDEPSLGALKQILQPAVETVLLINPALCRESLLETADCFKMFDWMNAGIWDKYTMSSTTWESLCLMSQRARTFPEILKKQVPKGSRE
jgi:flagellar biosynthesis protein FlhF